MPKTLRKGPTPVQVEPFLRVSVVRPEKLTVEGGVSDLCHEAASVSFDLRSAPRLEVGELVQLRISGRELPEPLHVPARVCFQRDVEKARIYRFAFVDWIGLQEQLPPALRPLFNQRDALRVQADPSFPIDVEIACQGRRYKSRAPLRDLSTQGLSVWEDPEKQHEFQVKEGVRIEFALPNEEGTLAFWASVRHRQLDAEGVWYGIAFDVERTRDCAHLQQRLLYYIAKRRQGERRRARPRKRRRR